MKNGPLYDVREIKDLKDMLRQSAEHYANDTAFLVKDPRAIGQKEIAQTDDQSEKTKSLPYLPVTYKKFAEDVDAFGTFLMSRDMSGISAICRP